MYGNLREAIKQKRLTQAVIAREVELSLRGFSLKLLHRNFTTEEMFIIHDKFFPDKDLRTLFAKTS